MGKVLVNSSTLKNIATAIRTKTNTNAKLLPSQMATAINGITGVSTTGDLYVSSLTPFKYRVVNSNPDLQSVSVSSTSSLDTTNQLVYARLSLSIRGTIGYAVGDVSKYYDLENDECVFSIAEPRLVADVTAEGYTVIYANDRNYYIDYNETNRTDGSFNGKLCLLKSANSTSISLAYRSGAVTEIYCPDITELSDSYTFLSYFDSSTKFKVILPNLLYADKVWGLPNSRNFDKLYVPKLTNLNAGCIFTNSISLIDFGNLISIDNSNDSFLVNTVIIRTPDTVCSLSNSEKIYCNKIYVPDNLVEAYETATNWSNMKHNYYPNEICPLSEYVEEGAE